MMYNYPHFMSMGSGWAVIVLPLLLAIAAVGLAALWPVHRTSGTSGTSAERTLDDRFARGEIDAEEYEQRMRTLQAAHR